MLETIVLNLGGVIIGWFLGSLSVMLGAHVAIRSKAPGETLFTFKPKGRVHKPKDDLKPPTDQRPTPGNVGSYDNRAPRYSPPEIASVLDRQVAFEEQISADAATAQIERESEQSNE